MKKAKLDILEELPEIHLALPETENGLTDAEIFTEAIDQRPKKWAFNKLIFIVVPAVIVVFVLGGVIAYSLFFVKTPEAPKMRPVAKMQSEIKRAGDVDVSKKAKTDTPGIVLPASSVKSTFNTVYVKDFMIDLKDSNGKSRVLFCDIAFELGSDQVREKIENNIDVRNVIYTTTKRHNAMALRSLEERKKLKQDLLSQFDELLGKGSVKDVYFINYLIM